MAAATFAAHHFRAHHFRAATLAGIPTGPQPLDLSLVRIGSTVASVNAGSRSLAVSAGSVAMSGRIAYRDYAPHLYHDSSR